ncbi:neutral zinc metallopeptidase [Octadecabacter sp. 1_MG-2023]|uniref:KPN_02809 family neutral zinc metallopeptidase n=1 Tax=unclassified Octadecabacter TaxID=196158 RepID=UPI001C09A18E|nr:MULTISPECIES: neutral zinc metallopeptidase [unclassified Octadecabacter]MBU2993242.1 neutral zinc metallopeptidase [Octadecabacter sp. B2R22]MDO6733303.1 neutral zinc metallopeptidase [Octadecabacter sp. 1_MG-2023]
MKWQGRRGSNNIEDRRRSGGARKAGGIGGIAGVLILLAGMYFGFDTSGFVDLGGTQVQSSGEVTEADERAAQFVSVTLADTEEIWAEVFQTQIGQTYAAPTLVLFKGATQSPCGGATAQSGPFYCPADSKAYLDTDFFVTMERQLGAGGDFAAAYVVAHEVAHHVQNELGILGQANRIRQQVSEVESNAISVRLELQADCFSGVWARYAQERFNSLERGDIAEAMNAAAQIGDDTLQRNAGRTVQPHTFEHGTSAQRQRWFQTGYDTAQVAACDTFSTNDL